MHEYRLEIPDMKCEGCAGTVREALQDVSGVLAAEVSLEEKAATVQTEEGVAADALVAAVEEAGYGAQAG